MLIGGNKRLRKLAGALETANLLSLKLLLKNPKNFSWFPGRVFRTYMRLVEEDAWPCRGIFEVFPEAKNVRFEVDYTPHQNGVGERLDWQSYLSCITKIVAPQAVFEIGTFRGQSALNFAVNSPADCTIYTLDLAPEIRERVAETLSAGDARLIRVNEVGIDYQGKQDARKIVQLWGDSRTFDFSPYYGRIDLVFIDGAHHYEAVINDTEQALKMVRPGGVIIWDNFSQYGDYNDVTRAVIERMGKQAIAQIEETELAIHRVSPTSVA